MLSTSKGNSLFRLSLCGFLYWITLLDYSIAALYEVGRINYDNNSNDDNYRSYRLGGYLLKCCKLDPCKMHDNTTGICRAAEECPKLKALLKSGDFSLTNVVSCGFKGNSELVCCPLENRVPSLETRAGANTALKSASRAALRPAVAACLAFEKNLTPVLSPHILDGIPVNPGEYPHMAAIGYSDIGNSGGPYNIRCGGALIDDRFVLTAAHCVVNSRNITPEIVRLGMSNFDDPSELPNRVEVPIKKIHVHPDYSTVSKVNDVALLELDKPLPRSRFIYPTCLYTEEADPPSDSDLFVAGWGVFNYTTNHSSNALLKLKMEIVPDHTCISAYSEHGYKVKAEHLCAADPKSSGDACWGDSGGPLFLILDESIKSFRQVGIISSGYGCAGPVPGLYMKVSSYVNYIESIVWPNGFK